MTCQGKICKLENLVECNPEIPCSLLSSLDLVLSHPVADKYAGYLYLSYQADCIPYAIEERKISC